MLENKKQRRKMFCLKHLNSITFASFFVLTALSWFLYFLIVNSSRMSQYGDLGFDLFEFFVVTVFVTFFFAYPIALTILNFICIFLNPKLEEGRTSSLITEILTWVLGTLFSFLWCCISDIRLSDWWETLQNTEMHTPIALEHLPTVRMLCFIGFLGYCLLRMIPVHKMPPLVIVTAMSALYIGLIEVILLMVQLCKADGLPLSLALCNVLLIGLKTIRLAIADWNTYQREKDAQMQGKSFLAKALLWPLSAMVTMLPLLGIMVCILALFGQHPGSFIAAFTQTADWNLSMR